MSQTMLSTSKYWQFSNAVAIQGWAWTQRSMLEPWNLALVRLSPSTSLALLTKLTSGLRGPRSKAGGICKV